MPCMPILCILSPVYCMCAWHVHVVCSKDLVAALGVSEAEAEEMIFIADLKDNQYIDFTEFKQVVVSWSG